MKRPKIRSWKWFASALLMLGVLLSSAAEAQEAHMWRATLKGVRAMSVQVSPLNQSSRGAGLSASSIRADTEIQLRRAGVLVEKMRNSHSEFLMVNVLCLPDSVNGYMFACNVRVGFYQPVALLRDTHIVTVAETWQDDTVMIMGRNKIKDARSTASDMVEEFVNDYLAANPNRP